MPKRIYVGNLPFKADRADLRDAFRGNAHPVIDVEVRAHAPSQTAAARIVVDDDGAEALLRALDGASVGGNVLVAGTDKSILVNHEEDWWP